MRTNYVLIDYENVQPAAMAALDQDHFKVIVFVGASQAKVSYEVASALQRMGSRASYVKISGNGSNALDFHIAYYIGSIAGTNNDAYFHIVSKDGGFDPLIEHLKGRKIFAARSKDVSDIPLVKAAASKTPEEGLAVVLSKLHQLGASKPRTVRTLSSTIASLFQKALSVEEVAGLLAQLQAHKVIAISGTKIAYTL